MAAFQDWLAALPETVRTHLTEQGFTKAELVADSAAPEYIPGPEGTTVEKQVDVVFCEAIGKNVDEVKRGTVAWALVAQFFRNCYKGTDSGQDSDVTCIEAKDVQAEEYYELGPDYRRRRVRALNDARQFEVEDARLPSARLWGRYERLKRVNKEFEPLLPHKCSPRPLAR